ncbi:fungal-specific transcription factor domain-containing protein, partial [Dipodascopsis uninucleata]
MSEPLVTREKSLESNSPSNYEFSLEESNKRQRKNSTRACDICKRRKVKCDGTMPCIRCIKGNIKCTYNEKYNRGIFVGPLQRTDAERRAAGQSKVRSAQHLTESDAGDFRQPNADSALMDGPLYGNKPLISRSGEHSCQEGEEFRGSYLSNSSNEVYQENLGNEVPQEENNLTLKPVPASPDTDALYSRDISEESAELRSQNQMSAAKKNMNGQFWFSELPVGKVDPKILALPTKKFALQMIEWYFDNANPTYRIMHRPTVEIWLESGFYSEPLYESSDSSSNIKLASSAERTSAEGKSFFNDRSISAAMFSIWALACQFPVEMYSNSERRQALKRQGLQYFLIAQNEIKEDSSLVDRLTTLQAKFIMCQYLLSTSRIKAAWDLLASVKNMSNNLDLNRRAFGYRVRYGKANDVLNIELRKRVFWAVYTLDSYMCTMLGKTLMLAEEDITVEYPTLTDDMKTAIATPEGTFALNDDDEPSLMCTPIAHTQLSRIIRLTLRKLYSDTSPENQEDLIDELGQLIEKWERTLPQFLRLRSSGGLKLPFSRQLDVIRLAHVHCVILIYRPSLNISRKYKSVIGSIPSRRKAHQELCLEAALKVSKMKSLNDLSGSYWFVAYIVFCAATVMLVYLSQNPETTRKNEVLQSARRLCDVERSLASQSGMANRYLSVLSELWRQVRKKL